MQTTLIRILLLTILGALAVACTDDKKSASAYDEANELMDRGAYSQSIAFLEPELERAPGDQQLRVLLAASYAGRAGITMQGYIDLAQEIVRTARSTEDFLAGRQGQGILSLKDRASDPNKKRALQFVESIYKASIRLNNFLYAFESIPVPNTVAGERDLRSAIEILDGDQRLQGGRALYRGLLRLSQLKLDVRTRYNFDYMSDCDINMRFLRGQFVGLKEDLGAILNDLAIGTLKPQTRIQMQDLAKKINRDVDQVLALMDGLGEEQAEAALINIQRNIFGRCE
jgi:hypothetical protein